MSKKKYILVSSCGIYCGACPSFQKKLCYGCKSNKKDQTNKFKWHCEIRKCCLYNMQEFICFDCNKYPCEKLIKLKNSNLNDHRYDYRHNIFLNMVRMSKLGIYEWLCEQKKIWKCSCGAPIIFYEKKCIKCEKKFKNVIREYIKNYKLI
ncbi:MAG: DUF3795 domain-containing protein [Promethearchaeota archaeon]